MDAILFSVNPKMARVDDALTHLADHEELYWEVVFAINRDKFNYPILGYMHICGNQVEYVATIKEIIPFSLQHYDEKLSQNVKPALWLREWKENLGNCRSYHWKNALVITQIKSFPYETRRFKKYDGGAVPKPPRGYIRVLPPTAIL